jgi:hypothetical protein
VKTFNCSFLTGGFIMDDKERRKLETFTRIEDFGTTHDNDFAANSLGKQLFAEISTIVAKLAGDASSEASGRGLARQGTSTRGSAREELRSDLEAIRRTARAMADDVPGLDDKFRVPRSNSDQELLAAARAVATDAAPLSAQFIAHELPADFLQDLQDDIAALEAAISGQASGVGDHVAASAEINATIEAGDIAKRKLDAIVRNKYANNPGVLAEWTSASHTERDPRHKSAPKTPATGPGTTSPPTPTA